jgi:sugar phosphate isomerase/epimerase
MKLSISNIAWEVGDDETVASVLQELGIEHIDLAPGKYIEDFHSDFSSECLAVKEWWLDRGIHFAGMQALLYGTSGLNVFGSADSQQQLLKHLSAVCQVGDALDARKLVFGSPKNRDRSGLSDEQALAIACEFFLKLAPVAESAGVMICLEPNPQSYGCNFMTTTVEAASVVSAINHPAIRLQLDTGSLAMNGENPDEICRSFQDLIGHVHVSEPQLFPVGTGTCDHHSCAMALARWMPDALATIEMLTRSAQDSIAAIKDSVLFSKQAYLSIPHAGECQ